MMHFDQAEYNDLGKKHSPIAHQNIDLRVQLLRENLS